MSDRKGKVKSDKERKKSEVDSEADIDGKKKMKEKDYCDGEKPSEREKLGDETVMEKKNKENKEIRDDSEEEDVGKKKKKKNMNMNMKEIASCDGEKLGDETVIGKKTKKNKEIRVDSEVEDDGKRKKKRDSGDDEIGSNESSKIDALSKKRKRKRDDTDTRAEENTENFTEEMKKSKKKRRIEDSEAEEGSKESTKDAKKEKKKKKKKRQSEGSETEESNKDSVKDSKKEIKKKKKKKQSEVSELEEGNKDSTKDAKKKSIEDPEAEQNNMESMEDGKKKRKKKKQKCCKSDENVTTPSSKSVKRVKFSDQIEVFPTEDEEVEDEVEEAGGGELVRGKRFTKEEDELIKKSVQEYIDNNNLGDEGLNMVMKCRSYPEVKDCWKQISSALPWRPADSVYYRAHILFEGGSSKGVWTEEELELVKSFKEKHGPDWKTLADALGKHRWHVKDAWRRIRLTMNKGKWSREEYQTLFDLVNKDLRLKAFQEKKSKHGMLRDNIPWTAISDKFGSRNHVLCCKKWYDQLTSPMVAKGTWANVDDYRLLDELMKLDATCIDDIDWDDLVENRDGEICRKRWNQMVLHIGVPGTKTFAEQVEILSNRYCPDLAEDRENFDNRPYDDDPEK